MRPLHDPQPGATGFLLGEGAACLLAFDDDEPDVLPIDRAGNLDRIAADESNGLTRPDLVTDGFTGPARRFTGSNGYLAHDASAATYLPQSVTVQAIVRWDSEAQAAAGTPGVVLSRGLGGTPEQRRCWQLQLSAADAPGTERVELAWQNHTDPVTVYPGAEFDHHDGWFLFTATREYVSPDRVLLRYWRNAELLAEHDIRVGNPGSIGGGVATGPVVVIGAAADGLGGYRDHFIGDIDSIVVRPYATTHEQVETLHRRLAFWQPQIARAHRDLLAPGTKPSRNPDSNAQRLLKATAQGVALAESMVEDFEQNSLPPRCYGGRLAQWEDCLALPRSQNVPIADRRLRVQAALRRELGFTTAALQNGLAPLLGIAPEQVELLTMSNLIEDRFEQNALNELLWRQRGQGRVFAWTGWLLLYASTGEDIRFDGATRNALFLDAPLCDSSPATFIAHLGSLVFGLLEGTEAGLCLSTNRDILWWTIRRIGNTHALGYRTYQGYTLSPWTQATAAITTPTWLRLQIDGANIEASYSQSSPYDGYADATPIALTGAPTWCGFSLRSDEGQIPSPAYALFDRAIIWTPNADRPFQLFAYRDPSLPGSYDLAGARIQIDKQRAARDAAAVCTSRMLTCDDAENGCDHCPTGGY